jgi:hypothetical protein
MKLSFKNNSWSAICRAVFILLLVINSSLKSYGQTPKNDIYPYDQEEETGKSAPSISQRLFFGGNIGLQFGSYTDIQISPIVGFWLLPQLAIAGGPTYRYYKDPYTNTVIYGGKTYMEFMIVPDLSKIVPLGSHTGIYLHGEDEFLSLKTSYWKEPPYLEDRFWVNTVLAGFGISQQLGKRSAINFTILWPLNNPSYSLYSNPEIRVSFNF